MGKYDLIRQLWLAAVLLTRLPLPHLPAEAFAASARAVWAYPVVGLLIGALAAGVASLALVLGLPVALAAGLALSAMMIATGAMHEDGLADLCDGFWGAMQAARRLEIMRDSQIGTYGVLGLIMVTGLRWGALIALLPAGIAPVVVAAALSRAVLPGMMAVMRPAREDGLARSVGQPGRGVAAVALALGALIACLGLGALGLLAVVATLAVALAMGALAQRKIGGQTGDVLGATQQIGEGTVLLLCVSLA